ncbi:hypothetical protein, partial [Rhodopirellula bahusiensis]
MGCAEELSAPVDEKLARRFIRTQGGTVTGKLIRLNQRKRSAKLATAKRVALALAIATSTAMGVSAQRPNQPQLKHVKVPASVAESVATRLSLQ